MSLNVTISPDEIAGAFAPYVLNEYARDDPEWQAIVARLERKEARRFERRERNERSARDRSRVEQQYASIWSRSVDEHLAGRPAAFEWSRGTYMARSIGRKRVHQLLLIKVLEAIRPGTVLEVGCGNGLNLLQLACHFPEITLAGLELTPAGIAAARDLLKGRQLHPGTVSFFPGSLRDAQAGSRVRLQRGDAAQLPYQNAAFDVICTVLALEQMESIRHTVMTELRRVASRYVVMIEPFYELNTGGLRRQYIETNEYFDARINELPDFGLRPVFVLSDIPNKVLFHVGLVVAEVA
jgi:ubiquinone/menaquinone biosynthesis C-methylase UbiE